MSWIQLLPKSPLKATKGDHPAMPRQSMSAVRGEVRVEGNDKDLGGAEEKLPCSPWTLMWGYTEPDHGLVVYLHFCICLAFPFYCLLFFPFLSVFYIWLKCFFWRRKPHWILLSVYAWQCLLLPWHQATKTFLFRSCQTLVCLLNFVITAKKSEVTAVITHF